MGIKWTRQIKQHSCAGGCQVHSCAGVAGGWQSHQGCLWSSEGCFGRLGWGLQQSQSALRHWLGCLCLPWCRSVLRLRFPSIGQPSKSYLDQHIKGKYPEFWIWPPPFGNSPFQMPRFPPSLGVPFLKGLFLKLHPFFTRVRREWISLINLNLYC